MIIMMTATNISPYIQTYNILIDWLIDWLIKWSFYTLSVSIRPSSGREHSVITYIKSGEIITWWMKLWRNLPPGHDVLLFSISGTRSFICPVAQTQLGIPRLLFTQSWTTGSKVKVLRPVAYRGGGGGAGGVHGPRAQALEGAPGQLVGANFKKKIRPRQISKVTSLQWPGLT